MARELIREEESLDEVAGGSFNWWREGGTRFCYVTGTGRSYVCSVDAKDTFAWLKAEHRGENWTEAMYVQELINRGDFTPV